MASQVKHIKPGTVIENFRITQSLGGGGFSIVYLAEELESGNEYVIKEYLPARLARRESDQTIIPRSNNCVLAFQKGRMMFFQEASTLATLQHENIVNVRSFFRANNTVYMALYYEDGVNLQEIITKQKGTLSEQFLLTILPPMIEALKAIHDRGYLHLDIKPGNIHIRNGNRPLLLDFGAVHQRQLSRQDQIGHVTSRGYSPPEQYRKNGYMGPWTDIYALGATVYTCMAGSPPPPANERHDDDTIKPAVTAFRRHYSRALLEVVDWALEIDQELRPQNLEEFRQALPKLENLDKYAGTGFWGRFNMKSARTR